MLTDEQKTELSFHFLEKKRLEAEMRTLLVKIQCLSWECAHESKAPFRHGDEDCVHCPVCDCCDVGYGFHGGSPYSYVRID